MSKKSYILMIFEGEKTEPQIIKNLIEHFNFDKKIVKAVYGTVIYSLYEEFFLSGEFDDELELFDLLKKEMKIPELQDIEKEFVDQIYLFFDYDGHSTNADNEKLEKILNLFNNETGNGKLYVSYPMIEAIKHLKDGIDFKNVIEESNSSYKELVSQNCDEHLCHLRNLSYNDWDRIIQEHSKKANFIVSDEFLFPNEIIEQSEIFNNQKTKFIEPHKRVAVLASFPLFLLDYYGIKKFIKDEEVIEE